MSWVSIPLHLVLTRLQAGRWKTDKYLPFLNFFDWKNISVANERFYKLRSGRLQDYQWHHWWGCRKAIRKMEEHQFECFSSMISQEICLLFIARNVTNLKYVSDRTQNASSMGAVKSSHVIIKIFKMHNESVILAQDMPRKDVLCKVHVQKPVEEYSQQTA